MVEGMQIEGEPVKRGPGRPPLRDRETLRPDVRADSVREAEEYARQITEAIGYDNYNPDEFFIDPSEIPDGWSYQWKAVSIAGKDNTYHVLELARNGWRAVPTSRHPHKMPSGTPGDSPIIIKGLQLSELPKVLTEQKERAHVRESKEVLRNSEAQLYDTPANTATREDPGLKKLGIGVTKEYMRPRGAREDTD